MACEDKTQTGKTNPGKLMALTLLLTVPAMMTGCNQYSSGSTTTVSGGTTSGGVTSGGTTYYNECRPGEEDCEYDGSHGVYVYSGTKKSPNSSYHPSSGAISGSGTIKGSSSGSHSGFGSGGTGSAGG